MRNVVMSQVAQSAILLAAVALAPASALAQGSESGDKYQLRRLAGHVLYAHGYAAEGFLVLEELGDHALTAGDTAGAIQAYHDAAWIAADAARELDATFDPKTIGVGVDRRPRAAAQEAQRVLGKATAIGGADSPQTGGLQIDRNVEELGIGIEVGRVLYAINRPHLAVMVYEKVGDGAVAIGDNARAERAYREGSWVARDAAITRNMAYDPKQIGIANPNFEAWESIASRLDEKANNAEGG